MIYISTSCLRNDRISETIETLVEHGFQNIELSGGSRYYPGLKKDLRKLQEKYDLNFLLHNYFPPPSRDFVLNLASLNQEIAKRSMDLALEAIDLARYLNSPRYGLHAGFYIDAQVDSLGKLIRGEVYREKELAYEKFCKNWTILKSRAVGIDLYIENNVYSRENHREHGDDIPFMLLGSRDYGELKSRIDFKLLLDVGHLRVSCKSLCWSWEKELEALSADCDYFHLSWNDGYRDSNSSFPELQRISSILSGDKVYTLEITGGVEPIKRNYEYLRERLARFEER